MFYSPFVITLTALLVTIGSACTRIPYETSDTSSNKQVQAKAFDRVAIYEKNTGKQPVQAQLLANIAVGYAQLGQREKASKLLSPALQTAKKNKSIHIKSDLLEKLGIIYVEMGKYDKAFQVAKSFQLYNPIDKDIELKHITTTMTAAGQYDKALQVAKLISIGGISSSEEDSLVSRSTVMAGVAVKYTGAGQKAKAEQILAQALELARTVKEKAEVANKYAEVGQQAKALQILARASEGADETDEMAAVAVKYAEIGQKYKAEQMLARALQITNNKKDGSSFKDHDLTIIAINYVKFGQFNQALQTAKSIKSYADYKVYKNALHVTPDGLISGSSLPDVFGEIAKLFAVAGRYDLAFQAIQEIKWTDNRKNALTQLAAAYGSGRQYEQAFEILKRIENPGEAQAEALAKIVDRATQAEQKDRALQVLKQALEVVKSLNWWNDEIEAFATIASEYVELEQKAKAHQVLHQALKVTETIRDTAKKADALVLVARNYAELGQKNKTEQLLAQALLIAEKLHQ